MLTNQCDKNITIKLILQKVIQKQKLLWKKKIFPYLINFKFGLQDLNRNIATFCKGINQIYKKINRNN